MIERYDVNEEFAHSGIIKAGSFYYLGYCVGNIGGTIEEQVNGAFDHMEQRLKLNRRDNSFATAGHKYFSRGGIVIEETRISEEQLRFHPIPEGSVAEAALEVGMRFWRRSRRVINNFGQKTNGAIS